MRGMGKRIDRCEEGEDLVNRSCFKKCQPGFSALGMKCTSDCGAPGMATSGSYCPRPRNVGRKSSNVALPGYERIGLRYFSPCDAGYRQSGTMCVADCPAGTTEGGWMGCKKQTYERVSHPAACLEHQEMSQTSLTCFDVCPQGSRGVGPFCFGSCPRELNSCFGVLCLPDGGRQCSSIWADMATRVQQIIDTGMRTDWGRGMLDFG